MEAKENRTNEQSVGPSSKLGETSAHGAIRSDAPTNFADFRALFSASPTAVALFAFDAPISITPDKPTVLAQIFASPARCCEANESFTKACAGGSSPLGRKLTDLLPPSAETIALFDRWIDNGFHLAHTPAHPVFVERGQVTYEFSLYPVFVEAALAKVWVLFRDVSDLQRALEGARRAEEHYRTLVERPGLVLVRTRPDNSYVYLSPHIEDIIGYTPEDFKRNPGLMEKLLHPEDVAKHAAIYHARQTKSRKTLEVEFRVRSTDGVYQWFLERQTPLIGPDGEVAFYDSVAINITERKQLEAQLLHSQRLDVMGQLSSGIAHDFNNHLTAIIGQIRLAQHALEPHHPAQAELSGAERAAKGCAEMIGQLLAFGRKSEQPSAQFELGATINSTVHMLRHFLPESVTLETAIDPDAGAVRGTPSQLQQVLMNLGINARDAMPAGGTLKVRVQRTTLPRSRGVAYPALEPGEYIEVSVTDTGVGIPPAICAHIFEPFFTTKPAGAGTGLGLSMARSIVEDHGGAIGVSSTPGQGTTLSFVLPRDGAPAEVSAHPASAPEEVRGGFILVAEDDSRILSVASTALHLHGYSVIKATDGEDALRLYDQHAKDIALVFVDQTMPRRSGLEVMESLRKKRPQLPIIFTSGHGKTGVLSDITDDDATVFMGKPYSLVDLLAIVRQLLDRSGEVESAQGVKLR
jgi:two-component system cell cycle sensor histidine kinase/response regulator CckA